MHIQQSLWTAAAGWQRLDGKGPMPADVVLYFAAPETLNDEAEYGALQALYPGAHVLGCTTGGEILDAKVFDGVIAATAIRFDRSTVRVTSQPILGRQDSATVGAQLAANLVGEGLKGVFVLSDGTRVNGSDLVRGLKSVLPAHVVLTGGLAGDGANFRSTLVGVDGKVRQGVVAAIGFYGDSIRLRHGSFGGWDPFGPERLITRSQDNVLFELDGEPALDLYERYLGDEAVNLPGSALLFPLSIRAAHDRESPLVRTVVGIDRETRAMIFAGDVPTGHSAQLMRGNFEHLIDGAAEAARQAAEQGGGALAVLISCIGRKLLLGSRIDEEVETACEVLGADCRTIGFYSYGEICPHDFTASCELHNQTMTITLIDEI